MFPIIWAPGPCVSAAQVSEQPFTVFSGNGTGTLMI